MAKDKIINWVIFILLSFIWGSSFILMKLSSLELNGLQIASVRISSAGFVFLPLALFHISKVPKNKIGIIFLSGLFGNLFPAFLFAIAISKKVDSSLAGILNSLTPLLVIIISILFFKNRVHFKKIAGVLIGFIGLLILSLSKGGITGTNFWFAFLILIATLFYGINVNIVIYYLKEVDPFKITTISLAFICVPAFIVLLQQNVIGLVLEDANYRWPVLASVILGVIGSAAATWLFYILIKRAGGIFASLVTYGIPVVAILWGIIFKENVTMIQVGCLAFILAGVYLANRS
ncbi:MAG TPA: DMT family transporter [Chitinophagaceae bacterium]|nr:DMT family transporter [Chitinophagaceae bacterium]